MGNASYIDTRFLGIDYNTGGRFHPPDNALALGPSCVVTAENSAIEITTLSGTQTYSASLQTFFGSLGSFDSIFDPRSFYDQTSGRFVVIADEASSGHYSSSVLMAVSKDSNPADGWTYAQLNYSGQGDWGDYPNVATDGTNTFVTVNSFTAAGDGSGSELYAIFNGTGTGASGLYAGSTTSTSTKLSSNWGFVPVGVAGNGAFFITSAETYSNGATGLGIIYYNDRTASFGTMTYVNLGIIDQRDVGSLGAAQKGTSQLLDAGDGRITGAVYANGYAYVVFEVDPSTGPNSGTPTAHWAKLNVADPSHVTLVAQGDVPAASGIATYDASIAVDSKGDMLINFVASRSTLNPTDYYVVHYAGTADTSFDAPIAYQSSGGAMEYGTGSSPGRWGDYSTAVADPNHPGTFWISNEYATGVGDHWGTVVAQVTIGQQIVASQAQQTLSQAGSSSVAVIDLAASVVANLDSLQALEARGQLSSVVLTDTGRPVITVTGATLGNDAGALGAITTSYSLSVTGTVSAGAASGVSASLAANLTAPLVVTDSAANVQSELAGLQAVATTGALGAITLTDGGTPSLTVTAAQLAADQAALTAIAGNFALNEDASAANVTIAGLSGHANTAVFTGTASQYRITASGDGTSLTVTDTGTGRSSIDHLTNISALKFSDVTDIVASQTPPVANAVSSAQVTELYSAVFGRTPDVAGLAFYQTFAASSPSTPFTQFAQWFLASPEYADNTAHNYAQTSAGDAQFIVDSYNNLLRRAPGSGDAAWYQTNVINPMLAGLTPGTAAYSAAEAQAHAQVLAYFSQSPEFLADVTVTAQNPSSAQHWLVLV